MSKTIFVVIWLLSMFPIKSIGATWETVIGAKKSHYQYDEPGYMTLSGEKLAITASETAIFSDDTFLKGNITISHGKLNYSSQATGTQDNVPDKCVEARLLAGSSIDYSATTTLAPYVGLGLRELNNGMAGQKTTTGSTSYRRTSQYLYVPLGVETRFILHDGWEIRGSIETAIFFSGKQTSHFNEVSPSSFKLNDAQVQQSDGSNYRISIGVSKGKWMLSGWLQTWKIGKSTSSPVGYGINAEEPQNSTYETGIEIKYKVF